MPDKSQRPDVRADQPGRELDGDVPGLTSKPITFQGVEYKGELVWERAGRD